MSTIDADELLNLIKEGLELEIEGNEMDWKAVLALYHRGASAEISRLNEILDNMGESVTDE